MFGLAALLIPGVGAFISAGWLASTLGVTGGALAGLFAKAGYDDEEAGYYGGAVERGGVLVAVDTSSPAVSAADVLSVLAQHGGGTAGAVGR